LGVSANIGRLNVVLKGIGALMKGHPPPPD